MKFEKGKWYKFSKWSNGEKDLCKCLQSSNTDILHNEEIKKGIYIKINNETPWYGEYEGRFAIEADPEDYSDFLPEGHPDKLITVEQDYSYLETLLNKLNIK